MMKRTGSHSLLSPPFHQAQGEEGGEGEGEAKRRKTPLDHSVYRDALVSIFLHMPNFISLLRLKEVCWRWRLTVRHMLERPDDRVNKMLLCFMEQMQAVQHYGANNRKLPRIEDPLKFYRNMSREIDPTVFCMCGDNMYWTRCFGCYKSPSECTDEKQKQIYPVCARVRCCFKRQVLRTYGICFCRFEGSNICFYTRHMNNCLPELT